MNNTVLELYITNAEKFNFYLHELNLTEGISQLSEACLTVYSSTAFSRVDLQKLISSFASVKITQKNNSNQFISRFFSGVISSVRHCGVAQRTQTKTICKYQLIVQSPLAKLQYAFPRRYSTSTSVGDLIGQILKDHNITGSVPDDVAGKVHPYFQGGSSDYEFLLRLLAEYDLNYMFKSLSTDGSEPEMHIFKTAPVLASDVIVNNQTLSEPQTLDFHCHNAKKNIFVMNSWEMSSSMGVDGVDIYYEDLFGQQSSTSSGEKGSARKKVFNSMPFGATETGDADRIVKSLLAGIESRKTIWQGTTNYLTAVPGMTLNVAEFDNTEESVTALVTTAQLTVITPWPSDFGACPDPDAKQYLNVQIRCCAPNANQTLLATAESDTTAIISGLFFHSGETKKFRVGGGTPELITATVCTREGAVLPQNGKAPLILSDSKDTYMFYAVTKNQQMLPVHLTMPLGGYKQGFFRVPRLGENVLLQGDGNDQYYLHSYLPNVTTMPFADDLANSIPDAAEMIGLRHISATPEGDSSQESPEPKPHTKDSATILDETTSDRAQDTFAVNSPNTSSEVSIHPADTSVEKPEDGSDPEKVAAYNEAQTLVNVASQGNIRLTANNNSYIQGKNIKLSTPGWKKCYGNGYNVEQGMIELTDFNALTVRAAHSITFQVGNNSISITPSGIAIRALKWSSATGPMDAAIYMDGISGISMSGMSCSMCGVLEAEISDGMGAGISASSGITNISGGEIELATSEKGTLAAAFGIQLAKLLAQFTSFCAGSENLDNSIYGISSALDGAIAIGKYAEDLTKVIKMDNGARTARDILVIIAETLKLVAKLIDMIWLCIDAWGDPEFLEAFTYKNAADGTAKVTNRDAFRLTAMCLQVSAWGIVAIALLISMKAKFSSSVSLACKKITTDAQAQEVFTVETKFAEAVVSGINSVKQKIKGQKNG